MRLLAVCVLALLLGFVGSMPLAGPIAVMAISRAASGRYGEAIRVALGAAAAEGLYAGAAFWGFTHLLARSPLVVPLSRGATALVLVPLGVRFMFWRPAERGDHRESKAGTALLGFSISALNPTLFVTWSAAVAFLYAAPIPLPTEEDTIPFGVSAAVGIGSWFVLLVALLRRYEGKLRRDVLSWTVRALGLVLLGIGVWSGIRLAAWLVHRPDRSTAGLPARRAGDVLALTCSPALGASSYRSCSRGGRSIGTE
ncbi:MAG: LysE family transporter [Myxococcales bacterium]|nr:LysE family transporter [Myxococcales bacterium]